MNCKPIATTFVERVTIRANETLTLFFHQGNAYKPTLVLLEARVTETGEIELFCNEPLTVQPFSEWAILQTDNEPQIQALQDYRQGMIFTLGGTMKRTPIRQQEIEWICLNCRTINIDVKTATEKPKCSQCDEITDWDTIAQMYNATLLLAKNVQLLAAGK